VGADEMEKEMCRRATAARRTCDMELLWRFARWYGPQFDEFLLAKIKGDEVEILRITYKVIERMKECFDAALRDFELEWVTKNPGAQGQLHTSSFHPITAPASAFYPPQNFRPMYIGLSPQISRVIAEMRVTYLAAWPRDVYLMLVRRYVIPAVHRDALNAAGIAALFRLE
jgi:hypothetical protein